MALLSDIRQMQSEGKTEQEIISNLRQQGVSAREIIDALSQSKIKEAVGAPEVPSPYGSQSTPEQDGNQDALIPSQTAEQASEMQPSQTQQEIQQPQPVPMDQSAQQQYTPQTPAQKPVTYQEWQQYQAQQGQQQNQQMPQSNEQNFSQEQYQQYPVQDYQSQSQNQISPDTITEIAEQIVTEKISPIRKDLEKSLDLRNTLETKMESLNERLMRIEKIIDRLNLSIMQKVGDYMTNIDDIKKELIETQKSFKSLVPSLDSKPKERTEKPKKLQQAPEMSE